MRRDDITLLLLVAMQANDHIFPSQEQVLEPFSFDERTFSSVLFVLPCAVIDDGE